MVEEIAPDVYKIHAEGNVYVILSPKVIVIDTSAREYRDLVKKEIASLISLDKVEYVLLTHLHLDHCGNVDLFTHAKIYAPKEDLDAFREDPGSFFVETKEVIETMKEAVTYSGDSIHGLEILHVPGHTIGSVAFLDKDKKILYSGDTIFENSFGRYDLPNAAPDNIQESVARLRGLVENEGYTLCPGHDY